MHPNDPALSSFITVEPDSHFPIQNLPYGVFSTGLNTARRVGVAIGGFVLDLAVLENTGLLADLPHPVFNGGRLNDFIALGRGAWTRTRETLSALLRADNPRLRDDKGLRARALIAMREVALHLPCEIPGYTDFYSSREHATNVGSMFRDPGNALLPNWLHMPVGYNGRASSVVVSGTPVRRPRGQLKLPDSDLPIFAPCRRLDFELETACFIGAGNTLGEPVSVDAAEGHIFGMVLMNDWSARDIQQWEYVPLGPFNAKSFATSISPWIVTLDALEPFRIEGPAQIPQPLPYLRQSGRNGFDIELEVRLRLEGARTADTISRTNFRYMYWSMAQQLAHHTASGCNLRIGDLMGSGTVSGPTPDSYGSLLELAWNGQKPLTLPGGAERSFIQDGDEIIMTGWCQGQGYRVGFGDVAGMVQAA